MVGRLSQSADLVILFAFPNGNKDVVSANIRCLFEALAFESFELIRLACFVAEIYRLPAAPTDGPIRSKDRCGPSAFNAFLFIHIVLP